MSLDVIGAGFGRTGTLSLKQALEELGFVKCHHMTEVFQNPDQAPLFLAAARGETVDWETVFKGYRAMVDFPGCSFWRELSEAFPQAKVVLSTRDPQSWFKSASETIFQAVQMQVDDPVMKQVSEMAREIVLEKTFGGDISEAHAVEVFKAHEAEVKRAIPADRLLVFEAKMGWEPLCDFLGVKVPETPYPRTNSSEEFQANMAGRK
ncbi:sulfotransferase family protein [Parvibaculum sp.]|uniref:sulfotransferase family protein n=1 Tax=Parvibaculum sp. TaxID=2024848 RepID=UPI000C99773B|nr:sulfotransferase family protein [Parvibaculum sp.]MAB14601.1 sulfotransferase family protein [Parvibaculum sp.]